MCSSFAPTRLPRIHTLTSRPRRPLLCSLLRRLSLSFSFAWSHETCPPPPPPPSSTKTPLTLRLVPRLSHPPLSFCSPALADPNHVRITSRTERRATTRRHAHERTARSGRGKVEGGGEQERTMGMVERYSPIDSNVRAEEVCRPGSSRLLLCFFLFFCLSFTFVVVGRKVGWGRGGLGP